MLTSTAAPLQAAEAVVGAQTAGDSLFPNVGNGGYDVQHYDLDIAWTPGTPVLSASSITATAGITAKAAQPLSQFSLDFYGLTVDSLKVNGQDATWTRISEVANFKHKLVITPATPVSGEFEVDIAYSGNPDTMRDPDNSREGWFRTDDGATALNEPIGAMTWYPNNNTPRDKATFDISLTIPQTMDGQNMAAASNGVLLSKTVSGSTATWNWRQARQMATYLSMVSIGKYDVHESDIVLESGTIRDWTFLDSNLTATQKSNSLNNLRNTQEILRWMESHFGPFPGVSSGAVVDRLSSGYALETQDRSFYPNSVSAGTLVHEIAHQWFGNAVSPTDWSDLWLNEGNGDYMPRAFNFETGRSTTSPETSYYNSWNGSAATAAQWRYPLAGFDNPAILFNYVYSRGGMSLEVLRTVVGDQKWYEIQREWIRRYNGGDASTADYLALAEELSGKDLSAVTDPWIFGTVKPTWPARWVLDVSSDAASPASSGDQVTYTLTARNSGRVTMNGAVASIDASGILDDAILANLGAGLSRDGGTLTWAVPSTPVGQSATTSFVVEVAPAKQGATLDLSISPATLGGFCGTCMLTSETKILPLTPNAAPTIGGVLRVDQTISAVTDGWRAGTTFTYQWYVHGRAVQGATEPTYTLQPQDSSKHVYVVATGSLPGWSSVTLASEVTEKVDPRGKGKGNG